MRIKTLAGIERKDTNKMKLDGFNSDLILADKLNEYYLRFDLNRGQDIVIVNILAFIWLNVFFKI